MFTHLLWQQINFVLVESFWGFVEFNDSQGLLDIVGVCTLEGAMVLWRVCVEESGRRRWNNGIMESVCEGE